MNLSEISTFIQMTRKEIDDSKRDLKIFNKQILVKKQMLKNIDESVEILTAVLSITQESITNFIEDVVSIALNHVYGKEYSFEIDYELKRGQPEVVMTPIKNKMGYDPRYSCGCGVLDVCSFALRCAIWALIEPQPSPVLILDEPFRYLHGKNENECIGIMVKELSEILGLQIIIVSGESNIVNYANKIFEIKQENGISYIEVLT